MSEVQSFIEKIKNVKHRSEISIYNEIVEKVKKDFVGTYNEIEAEIKNAKAQAAKEYRKEMDEYYRKKNVILNEFKLYLFDEYGVKNGNNEINEYIYRKASEEKFLEETESKFEEYAEVADFVLYTLNKK